MQTRVCRRRRVRRRFILRRCHGFSFAEFIQIPRASGSEGNHQNCMQREATKITQRSRTPRSPTPMHQNAQQLHAPENPRLLQIQHSPPREFIDRNSQFHLLFLLPLRHRQPPPSPPSPASAGAAPSRITTQKHSPPHRSKTPQITKLRVL